MGTETEARYIVPDQALFNRLRKLRQWAIYGRRHRRRLRTSDCYLDTRGNALLRQEWACRLREQNDLWILTLKGPKTQNGAVMRRPEFEITLPVRQEDPSQWPPGMIRSRVSELTGGLPLQVLLEIRQRRHQFVLTEGSREVAEISLDRVRVHSGPMRHQSYLLECELRPDGTDEDLAHVDRLLREDYGLLPEGRSKLRRALEWVQGGGSPDSIAIQGMAPASIETLIWRYGVDRRHAQRVADHAKQLCAWLAPVHGMPDECRAVVETAGLLHNVGGMASSRQRDLVSRDILLRQPIEGLDAEAQRAVGATAFLHRGAITSERIAEILPEPLDEAVRRRALVVVALVRIANGLDAAGARDLVMTGCEITESEVRITLDGENIGKAAKNANKASDLWDMLYSTPLVWETPQVERRRSIVKTGVGMRPSDSMGQAAAKVLDHHFQVMLNNEEGTRLGDDIEALHDMRVATRRMRSAMRLFGPFVQSPHVSHCNAGLRRAGRALGRVRDLDVALERVTGFAEGLERDESEGLEFLVGHLQSRRDERRRLMVRHLDSQTYQMLLSRMERLLGDLREEDPEHASPKVGTIAPRLLYLDWSIVRAYGHVLEHAPVELLHSLRIDCKRLRYALEFFAELLSDDLVSVIPEVTVLQDHLGTMRDAYSSVEMIDDFTLRYPELEDTPGIEAYRQRNLEEGDRLVQSFPEAWQRFSQTHVKRELDRLIQRTS